MSYTYVQYNLDDKILKYNDEVIVNLIKTLPDISLQYFMSMIVLPNINKNIFYFLNCIRIINEQFCQLYICAGLWAITAVTTCL